MYPYKQTHISQENKWMYFCVMFTLSTSQKYSNYYQQGGNKEIGFDYSEDLIKTCGYISIYDRKLRSKIPSWCGVSYYRKTWEELDNYINKRLNKNK